MTKTQAIAEAKEIAKLFGWGYAIKAPGRDWTASRNSPVISFKTKIIEYGAEQA